MKKILVAFLAFSICMSSFASTYDISSVHKEESKFIRVNDSETHIAFRFCDKNTQKCYRIGKRNVYSKAELKKKRIVEFARMGAVTALDAGLVIVAVAGITVSFLGIPTATMAGSGIHMAGGAAVATGAIAAPKLIKQTLNPFHYKGTAKMSKDVLKSSHRPVVDIIDYKNRLDDLLNELN